MLYAGRLLSIVVIPVILVAIIWFTVIKPKLADSSSEAPTKEQLYLLVFLGATEYMAMLSPSAGCLFRLDDYESRILHFLFTSSGSRPAYFFACVTYDFLEKLFGYFLCLFFTKLIVTGEVLPSTTDLQVFFFYSIYDLTRSLITFYPVSYLFETRKALMNYGGLLSGLCSLVFLILTSFSLVFNDSPWLLVNCGVIMRVGLNLIVSILPTGTSKNLNKLLADNIRIHGGLADNFILISMHFAVYVCLVLYIDYRSSLVLRKRQDKEARVPEELNFRNLEELQAEKLYLDSAKPNVRVFELEKTYSNKFVAAQNVTFGLDKGSLFTLLGPNGAGKTSVLEVLCRIQHRTDGEVFYEGEFMDDYRSRDLSFCLQKNYLWEELTFREHVEVIGKWRGLSAADISNLIAEMDKGLSLGKNLDIRAEDLSGGNKRKLNTFLAMMAAPHIYILDEPTAGMDPLARRYPPVTQVLLERAEDLEAQGRLLDHPDHAHRERSRGTPGSPGALRQSRHHAQLRDDQDQLAR